MGWDKGGILGACSEDIRLQDQYAGPQHPSLPARTATLSQMPYVWSPPAKTDTSFCHQLPLHPTQLSSPHYVMLVTDVGGEQRFASSVARRLETLGAITRGDRCVCS